MTREQSNKRRGGYKQYGNLSRQARWNRRKAAQAFHEGVFYRSFHLRSDSGESSCSSTYTSHTQEDCHCAMNQRSPLSDGEEIPVDLNSDTSLGSKAEPDLSNCSALQKRATPPYLTKRKDTSNHRDTCSSSSLQASELLQKLFEMDYKLLSIREENERRWQQVQNFMESFQPKESANHSPISIPPPAITEELLLGNMTAIKDYGLLAAKIDNDCLRTTVRTFIRFFMERSLAEKYSWSGLGMDRKKVKRSFKDHDLFIRLQKVLQHTAHKSCKPSALADAVQRTLHGVKDWNGGRAKRQILMSVGNIPIQPAYNDDHNSEEEETYL